MFLFQWFFGRKKHQVVLIVFNCWEFAILNGSVFLTWPQGSYAVFMVIWKPIHLCFNNIYGLFLGQFNVLNKICKTVQRQKTAVDLVDIYAEGRLARMLFIYFCYLYVKYVYDRFLHLLPSD